MSVNKGSILVRFLNNLDLHILYRYHLRFVLKNYIVNLLSTCPLFVGPIYIYLQLHGHSDAETYYSFFFSHVATCL